MFGPFQERVDLVAAYCTISSHVIPIQGSLVSHVPLRIVCDHKQQTDLHHGFLLQCNTGILTKVE